MIPRFHVKRNKPKIEPRDVNCEVLPTIGYLRRNTREGVARAYHGVLMGFHIPTTVGLVNFHLFSLGAFLPGEIPMADNPLPEPSRVEIKLAGGSSMIVAGRYAVTIFIIAVMGALLLSRWLGLR